MTDKSKRVVRILVLRALQLGDESVFDSGVSFEEPAMHSALLADMFPVLQSELLVRAPIALALRSTIREHKLLSTLVDSQKTSHISRLHIFELPKSLNIGFLVDISATVRVGLIDVARELLPGRVIIGFAVGCCCIRSIQLQFGQEFWSRFFGVWLVLQDRSTRQREARR